MLDMPSNKAGKMLRTPTSCTLCLVFLLNSQFFVIKCHFFVSKDQPFSTHHIVTMLVGQLAPFQRNRHFFITKLARYARRNLVLRVVGYWQRRLHTTVKSAASVSMPAHR
jgi:hypothetical protein